MVRFFTSSTKLQLRPTNYPVQNGDCDPNLESVELQLFSTTASNASAVSEQEYYDLLLNNEVIANLGDTGKQKVAFLITLISVATRDEHKNNSRFPIDIDRVTSYLINIVQIKDHAVAKEIAQALLGAVQIEESLTHANLTNFLRISLDMVVVQPCDVEHALTSTNFNIDNILQLLLDSRDHMQRQRAISLLCVLVMCYGCDDQRLMDIKQKIIGHPEALQKIVNLVNNSNNSHINYTITALNVLLLLLECDPQDLDKRLSNKNFLSKLYVIDKRLFNKNFLSKLYVMGNSEFSIISNTAFNLMKKLYDFEYIQHEHGESWQDLVKSVGDSRVIFAYFALQKLNKQPCLLLRYVVNSPKLFDNIFALTKSRVNKISELALDLLYLIIELFVYADDVMQNKCAKNISLKNMFALLKHSYDVNNKSDINNASNTLTALKIIAEHSYGACSEIFAITGSLELLYTLINNVNPSSVAQKAQSLLVTLISKHTGVREKMSTPEWMDKISNMNKYSDTIKQILNSGRVGANK